MDTKGLITSNGNKTGKTTCWMPNKRTKECYGRFFKFMAEQGWKEYKDVKYLQKAINEHAALFKKENEAYDEENYMSIDAHLYSGDDTKRLEDKFKGNVLEIISEGYFRFSTSQKYLLKFKCWSGQSSDDRGIDGYATSLGNDEYLVAIQAKFRSHREVGWQDGIQKAYALITDEMEDKLRRGKITGEDYLRWVDTQRVVLVTTTDASRFLKENSKKWLLVIDQNELFRTLGMFTPDGNRYFWEKLYSEMFQKK